MRRSVWFNAPYSVSVRETDLPQPSRGTVLIQTICSAISAGTELLVYRGQLPEKMAVDATLDSLNQQSTYPIQYGYSLVGRVIEVGDDVDPAWLGRTVFAFHPHESHFVTPIDQVIPLPQGIDPEDAVFLPNVETAVSFVMDGQPVIGERVLVLGQGIVGLLTTAMLARFPLDRLMTVDGVAKRREMSRLLGGEGLDLTEIDHAPPADLTYELSGNPAALNLAIEKTGFDGRVVIGSWYGTKQAPIDLGGPFHRSHIKLISSQVSHLNPRWTGRWTKERRMETAWKMLRQLRPSRLITHREPVERAAELYKMLDEAPQDAIQTVFTYP